MGLTDYLGKKRRLMIVKEVEFGVYLGNKDDKVLLPKKQVPKDVEVGDPVEVLQIPEESGRSLTGDWKKTFCFRSKNRLQK